MTDENTAAKLLESRPRGDMVAVLRPDHGWLVFLFPPSCADRLGQALMKQSALCDYFAGTLPPSTVTVN
jgi:hypothetical protein